LHKAYKVLRVINVLAVNLAPAQKRGHVVDAKPAKTQANTNYTSKGTVMGMLMLTSLAQDK
jgi:hypothetical protein